VSLSVHVRSDHGAVVVALVGVADATMIEPLRDPIAAALADSELLVLDLGELSGVDPPRLGALIVDIVTAVPVGQLRVATSHAATIAELAHACIDHRVAVHLSVADALADELAS
jgi:hypothetical protein